MAKPKGKKDGSSVGKITRRPKLKGSIKNKPSIDWIDQIDEMNKHVSNFETTKFNELLEKGTPREVAKNIANHETRRMIRKVISGRESW